MSYGKDKERLDPEKYAAQNENARREDTAALNGMTIGILLALVVAVLAGTFFYLNRRDESPVIVTPTLSPTAAPSSSPVEKQTIIREEKTRELVPVPVPQATTPQSTAPQPNINITIPSAPSSSAPPSSSSDTEGSSPAASVSPEAQSSPSVSPSANP